MLAMVLPASVVGRSILGDLIETFHQRPRGIRRWMWFWFATVELALRYGPARMRVAQSGRWHRRWPGDLRYAFRLLTRRSIHTTVSVIGLGVGITATIAVYSFFNAAWGDPPGVIDGRSIALARFISFQNEKGFSGRYFSTAEATVALRGLPGLDSVAAFGVWSVTLHVGQNAETIGARFISGNYFTVLNTTPIAGRVLGPDDDRTDAGAAMISEDLATRLFASPHEAVGAPLHLGDRNVRVVGVLPRRFARTFGPSLRGGPEDAVFLPMSLHDEWPGVAAGAGWASLVGRLRDGVDIDQLTQITAPVAREIEAAETTPVGRVSLRFENLLFGPTGNALATFASLCMAGPVLLLLIGCANVANLRLAQATERAQEIAVRQSLGATRGDIIRLSLLESLLVSALAIGLAWLGTQILLMQFADVLPIAVPLDWSVALFAGGIGLTTTLLSGVVPAWIVTSRNAEQLKQSKQAGGYSSSRWRHALMVVQLALSVILLTMGALFVRTAQEVQHGQPPVLAHVVIAQIDLSRVKTSPPDPDETARFDVAFMSRIGNDPRVLGAGLLFAPSLYGAGSSLYWLPNQPPRPPETTTVHRVSPSWFGAMDLAPLAGRLLRPADGPDIVVANESFAALIEPFTSPLGATVLFGMKDDKSDATAVTIVGVVPDSIRKINRPLQPVSIVYRMPPSPLPSAFTAAVRTDDPDVMLRELPQTLRSIHPDVTWRSLESAEATITRDAGPFRFFATTVAALGLVSLAVAGVGLFSTTSYLVSLRTREFGVRIALGARASDVVRLVFRQVGWLTLAGLGSGIVLTAPITNLLRFLFLGLSPGDPLAIVAVVSLLGGTTLVAGALPARRAASVDPVRALRAE